MSFNEGDLLYVSEDTNNTESAEWLQARCGTYIGLVPRNCGNMYFCVVITIYFHFQQFLKFLWKMSEAIHF